ncbi:hypothetical protein HanRHA438_Chr03g0106411 [Helianthus annuus]|uniref:uncharacterized protein LOC110940239 isoform X2 n=1 Tax=Helianthus annuus TaxID=4232 RepID=UPI000B908E07|nr:uncharacterized protein LOC110940239 isoform X2 [Helianthus annuus]XP_022037484.1 uncharacterized protein LOC110940239 isoform X2 [Helianthus annuus]KAJ0934350.1 hypothetical protein HanRHA438_Chr03g0106411 [Helianthus annuus]
MYKIHCEATVFHLLVWFSFNVKRILLVNTLLRPAINNQQILSEPISLPIEKLNLVIKELIKEKDEEKERFNGIIAGLLAEKDKDKVDKDAMFDRMSQIEAMLTATVRR